MAFQHTSVLLNESIALLADVPGCRFIDGTLGGAGHASALLAARPDAQLLGIDRDPAALAAAQERLAVYGERAHVAHGSYSNLANLSRQNGWENFDALFLDLGVSSPQIDTAERGFSFRMDGPLDMRMDPTASLTAADILNSYPEEKIADILYLYGEERRSRQIARAVVARREKSTWKRTGEFAAMVNAIVGFPHQHGLPPATRSFQALRIAVNNELQELETGLAAASKMLNPGGRIVVITFHSLEDRIVKHFFQHEAATCVCPPGIPICTCGKVKTMEILTKKPIRPGEEECAANSRAACSKLRAAYKL